MKTLYNIFLESTGIATDSRQEVEGKLFFALSGEHFDGNKYADAALGKGALRAVVDDPALQGDPRCFYVDNSLQALQALAQYHRRQLGVPLLAITGSNGKTTTKELVAAVLAQKFKVVFTQGNLNNHIGVPLTLLRMDTSTEFGVVEMGANHQKEIAALCRIAEPDYGYITNFGKAHLEGFGGFEGVIKGKSELYDFLREQKKIIFVNQDDTLQVQQSAGGHIYSFGESDKADCVIEKQSQQHFAGVQFNGVSMSSHLLGGYNAMNITAAVGIGRYFEIPVAAVKNAIEGYRPIDNRSQIFTRGTNKIILDAYNANPTSMALAISNLKDFRDRKQVVMLGDMFEIGETSLQEHQKIVDQLEGLDLYRAFVCGATFGRTKTTEVQKFESFEAFQKAVREEEITNSVILIKGSRGMAMERILDVL